MTQPALHIGIEEDYQIIDPKTRELSSYVTQILEEGQRIWGQQMKPELQQSMVEISTIVCKDVDEARTELIRLRGEIIRLTAKGGLKIEAAGTHPFPLWEMQKITPIELYFGVQKDMQIVADQLLIFGIHIHIGIEDREFIIDAMNAVRNILPLVLCLSSSSPFWMGCNTGFKSYRCIVFRHFPRTGIPRIFRSWREYTDLLSMLEETKCIPDTSKVWWDVRSHWKYPTLEIRICDVCTKIDEVICIAAILQTAIFKFCKIRQENLTGRIYPAPLIEENKWRAARYGLEGNIVNFGKLVEVPAKNIISRLIEDLIKEAGEELGSTNRIKYANRILEEGSSADRQLATFEKTKNLKAVVDQLIDETAEGINCK